MHIKRYTIASFIWIALVAWYVYAYVTPEAYLLDLFGIHLPALFIALLVVLPIFVLYVASVLHMWFYAFLSSFKLRKYEKDYEKIIDAIVEAYLGKVNRHYEFKTDRYKLLGLLLENTSIAPRKDFAGTTNNEKIDNILEILNKIQSGEVVDLKPYNLLPENELVIANELNKYKNGSKSAEKILSGGAKYADSLKKEVYKDFVKEASLENIVRYKEYMSTEALNRIFSRINADQNRLEIPNEKLMELINAQELSKEDFISISTTLSTSDMIPEQRIKLFEMLSEKNDDAMEAYLYTLYDLEMVDLAADILNLASEDEYKNFRAYKALKECGQNFDIKMFI